MQPISSAAPGRRSAAGEVWDSGAFGCRTPSRPSRSGAGVAGYKPAAQQLRSREPGSRLRPKPCTPPHSPSLSQLHAGDAGALVSVSTRWESLRGTAPRRWRAGPCWLSRARDERSLKPSSAGNDSVRATRPGGAVADAIGRPGHSVRRHARTSRSGTLPNAPLSHGQERAMHRSAYREDPLSAEPSVLRTKEKCGARVVSAGGRILPSRRAQACYEARSESTSDPPPKRLNAACRVTP